MFSLDTLPVFLNIKRWYRFTGWAKN